MWSHLTLQPGEVRGCTGCHESKTRTPRTTMRSSTSGPLRRDIRLELPDPFAAALNGK